MLHDKQNKNIKKNKKLYKRFHTTPNEIVKKIIINKKVFWTFEKKIKYKTNWTYYSSKTKNILNKTKIKDQR